MHRIKLSQTTFLSYCLGGLGLENAGLKLMPGVGLDNRKIDNA